jgi:unsaturated chondroitin disaccharide hydrolase
MKTRIFFLFLTIILFVSSCTKEKPMEKVIDESLAFSVKQYSLMTAVMKEKPDLLPRTLDKDGNLKTENSRWWTSGFFPGSLWYLYEYSKDPQMLEAAKMMTDRVEREKYTTNNHDVGFMIYCSFGNGLRLTGEESYNEVILTGAKSLSTRRGAAIKSGSVQSSSII